MIVENKGGAGGNLGSASVAKAEPDGYTILMGTVATHALNPSIYKKMPYDAVDDFAPISLLVTVPNVLVVNPQLPVKNVEELIALLKAEPGKYSYASSGNGTPLHLSGELFKSMAGVDMVHIPYKGAGPALTDLLGNHVPIMFDNLPSSTGYIKDGRLRGLAVTTAERSPSMPDLPTIAESGLPGYETYTWNALFAPAGTPPEVIARLNAAAVAAVADPEAQAKLQALAPPSLARRRRSWPPTSRTSSRNGRRSSRHLARRSTEPSPSAAIPRPADLATRPARSCRARATLAAPYPRARSLAHLVRSCGRVRFASGTILS